MRRERASLFCTRVALDAPACGRSTSSLAVMSRGLLALLLLTGGGCVWPAKTTYYEAVDKPWSAVATEGNLAKCPPQMYGLGDIGATRIALAAGDYGGSVRVSLHVYIWRQHQLTFPASGIRLTSLSDPRVQSSAPISFYVACPSATVATVERTCPRVPAEPPTLLGPAGTSPRSSTTRFIGFADVPPELLDGFLVELPDVFDGPSKLDVKPLKFKRRTEVLLRGTFGCD